MLAHPSIMVEVAAAVVVVVAAHTLFTAPCKICAPVQQCPTTAAGSTFSDPPTAQLSVQNQPLFVCF